mgnify:CR=1 FL=1
MLIPWEYLLSTYALITNAIILIPITQLTIGRLKSVISLCSGKYHTEGVITHSEYGMFTTRIDLRPEALVCCRYQVDGKTYNLQVNQWGYSAATIAKTNPKGKKVTVYYSHINPTLHSVDGLPIKLDNIVSTIFTGIFFYSAMILINYSLYKTFYLKQ